MPFQWVPDTTTPTAGPTGNFQWGATLPGDGGQEPGFGVLTPRFQDLGARQQYDIAARTALGARYNTPAIQAYQERAYNPMRGRFLLDELPTEGGLTFAQYAQPQLAAVGTAAGGFDPRTAPTATPNWQQAIDVARMMGTTGAQEYQEGVGADAWADYAEMLRDPENIQALADLGMAGMARGGIRGAAAGRGISRKMAEFEAMRQNPELGGTDWLGYLASILPTSTGYQYA